MKFLKSMLIVAALVCLAACSGSSSYNPKVCKELQEKIEAHQDLTEADYSTMIDQLGAAAKELHAKKEAIGNDKEKTMEWAETEEAKDLLGYTFGFSLYLAQHKSDLSESNIKALEKVGEEMKKLDD